MSDIAITQDFENAIEQAQVGESVAIYHRLYSRIEFFQDGDRFSFECRTKRSGRLVQPRTGRTPWHDMRMWKTFKGAKRNAVKFLEK